MQVKWGLWNIQTWFFYFPGVLNCTLLSGRRYFDSLMLCVFASFLCELARLCSWFEMAVLPEKKQKKTCLKNVRSQLNTSFTLAHRWTFEYFMKLTTSSPNFFITGYVNSVGYLSFSLSLYLIVCCVWIYL